MLDFYCFTSSNTHQQQKTQTDEQQRMKQPCRQLPCHGHQLYCRSVLSANDSECFDEPRAEISALFMDRDPERRQSRTEW